MAAVHAASKASAAGPCLKLVVQRPATRCGTCWEVDRRAVAFGFAEDMDSETEAEGSAAVHLRGSMVDSSRR